MIMQAPIQGPMMADDAMEPQCARPSLTAAVLWCSGPLVVLAGITLYGLWRIAPWERFGLSVVLATIAFALAWPLVRWRRWRWASALALVWIAALTVFVGPSAVLAVALLGAASLALGLRWVADGVPARAAVAAVSGYAVIAGLAGWVLQWPIHRGWAWLALLAVLLVSNRRAVMAEWHASRNQWAACADAYPRGTAWMVMLLGLASTGAWLPTMQADDLTYHLNLPAQLALHARYQGEPLQGAWAFAPWLGDVGHGIAWLLAGQEARGALNALWLLACASTLGGCAHALGARRSERIAAIALLASFPPLVWLAAGMQTELPAMAVLFALAILLLHRRRDAHLVGIAVLFAALAALKPIHAVAALPLLAYAFREDAAHALRRLPVLAVIVLAVGGASYAQAWWHTGNPLFPLFNAFFESPDYPLEDMADGRWMTGLHPALPWSMTFHTHRYLEAWDGGIGFLWIGGVGAWLLAVYRRTTRMFALVAACIALLPLVPMQYARYAFPGLLLVLAPMLAGSRERVQDRRLWLAPVVLLCALNLVFQANSGWTHHSAALKRVVRAPFSPASVFPYYVAERTLIARLPADDTAPVLATDPDRGYIAELGGRGRAMTAHVPVLSALREQAEQDASGARWRALFNTVDAGWILVTDATASPALMRALEDDPLTHHVETVNGITLWQRVRNSARPDSASPQPDPALAHGRDAGSEPAAGPSNASP